MNVGVRKLRDGLSRHLVAVRGGEEITVTDHGKPVARLVPYDAESGLEKLIAPALLRALKMRARRRGSSIEAELNEMAELGVEHSEDDAPKMRNGIPVLTGAPGHVITDELVAEHLDDW